jgi:hypothetical protein
MKEDFVGFTYKGIHSSQLGIKRVYEDRYTDTLTAEIKDQAFDVSGLDG